jgi:hypothetical protein
MKQSLCGYLIEIHRTAGVYTRELLIFSIIFFGEGDSSYFMVVLLVLIASWEWNFLTNIIVVTG